MWTALSILTVTFLAQGAEPRPASPADPRRESHERMIATLRAIREATDATNPFLGNATLLAAEQAWTSLKADASPLERWRAARTLGTARLRMGEFEPAVEAMLEARKHVSALAGKISEGEARATFDDVGIAWLRLGETQNCVARHTSRSCILPIESSGVHQDQESARKAIAAFHETLRYFPEDPVAIWLLNLASMAVGDWPDKVDARWRIPASTFESDEAFPRFVDVAPELGLNTFDLSGGSVVDDFDGDGDLDVVTSTWDTRGSMKFHRNRGDGTFVDDTAGSGLDDMLGGINAIQGDYDNDGDLDLFVMRGAWLLQAGRHPNSLLENQGGGKFLDVTYLAGLAEPFHPTHSAAFADFDLDGDLDLYVGNESRPEDPHPSQLFRNDGGKFVDVAARAGVSNLRYAKGVTWGDYDGDRDPDLYVSNLFEPNRLYRNQGDGTFRDVATELGVTTPLASFPTWWWDFDNDGVLDLFVSSWERDVSKYVASLLGRPFRGEGCRLYRGDGRGGFQDVAPAMGLVRLEQPMGANFGDLDGDGWLDFYLGTGYPEYEALMPNAMYRNVQGRSFADITTAGGFGHLQKGHGISFADLDEDGDVDVHEQMGGAFPGDKFGNVVYRNPGFGRRWLKVQLVGRSENRCAIGARLCVEIEEGGAARKLYRHVNSGGSFGSNPLRQELGLGSASRIEAVEILWPRTGRVQRVPGVPLDSTVRITEGVEGFELLRPAPTVAGK